jgi:outer membrane murein-binding lipoprotein Lpp
MHDDVPLVVTEVNADALADHRGIVANPNCTTMVAMLPLKALHDQFGLRAMVATSFQAAGGAGQKGIDELAAQVGPLSEDVDQLVNDGDAARRKVEHSVHADTLAFNVVPLLGKLERGLHRRGDEAPERVAQDPRRSRISPSRRPACASRLRRPLDRRARDVRRAGRPAPRRRGPRGFPNLVVQEARRRWSGPAATRSPSAACAPISPTRAR